MATVPRIAAVSCFSTMPLIYGVRRAGNLRAELLLSDPEEVIREFSEHRADIALVPFWAVPSLAGAKIVTEYCVGGVPAARHALLAALSAIDLQMSCEEAAQKPAENER